MTPLTLAEIRDTMAEGNPAPTAALLRDLDWMIRDGFDVRPAPAEGLRAEIEAIGYQVWGVGTPPMLTVDQATAAIRDYRDKVLATLEGADRG